MRKPPLTNPEIRALSSRLEPIARSLVFEEHDPEDLVQDAWLAALESPRWPRKPLGFLKTVMRRQGGRDRWRTVMRREREELGARSEASSSDEVERASTAAFLRRCVEELGAPYTEVVEARYFDGLSAPAIAQQLGRPVATVRTQLARGLAQLRERLDRAAGSRDAWVEGLIAIVSLPGPAGPEVELESSTHWTTATLGLATTGVVATVLATSLWLRVPAVEGAASPVGPGPRDIEQAAAAAPVEAEVASREDEGQRTPAAPVRNVEPVAASAPVAEPPAAPVGPDESRLLLSVVDAGGEPVPEAHAEVRGRDRRLLHIGPVGADGKLELDIAIGDRIAQFPMQGAVTVAARRDPYAWPGVFLADMEPGAVREVRIELNEEAVETRGVVRDTSGEPIAGASVESRVASEAQVILEEGLLRAPMLVEIWADSEGRYTTGGLPAGRQVVRVSAPGYVTSSRFVDVVGPVTEQDFVLSRGAIVAGFVQTADGRAAANARVWIGSPSLQPRHLPEARTDDDGFFLMSGLAQGSWELFACAADDPQEFAWVPIEAFEDEETGVDMVLAPTQGVHIEVVDSAGDPVPDVGVALTPTEPRSPWSTRSKTDAAGQVHFLHVADVDLDVRVYPDWLDALGDEEAFVSGVRPGERPVRVRLGPQPASKARLRGRVAKSSGDPLSGALIHLVAEEVPNRPMTASGKALLSSAAVRVGEVDARGVFEMDDIPPGTYSCWVISADASCAGVFGLGQATLLAGETLDLGERRSPLPRRVHFEGGTDAELTARVGPYWQRWMHWQASAGSELAVLPGSYRMIEGDAAVTFEVADRDVVVATPGR